MENKSLKPDDLFITKVKTSAPKIEKKPTINKIAKQFSAIDQIPEHNLFQKSEINTVSKQDDSYEERKKKRAKRLEKWNVLIESIDFRPKDHSYYRNLPIKPGIDIYRAIIDSRLPFSRLKVKIHETLATFDKIYWIGYNYQTGTSFLREVDDWNATPKIIDRNTLTPDTE